MIPNGVGTDVKIGDILGNYEGERTFEGDDNFSTLPAFGVIPRFSASSADCATKFRPCRAADRCELGFGAYDVARAVHH